MRLNSAKDLEVYKGAYDLAMRTLELYKTLPADEKYGLVNQIRRSSGSVCLNLREAWARRSYEPPEHQQLVSSSPSRLRVTKSGHFKFQVSSLSPLFKVP